MEFKLAPYNVAVEQVSLYATGLVKAGVSLINTGLGEYA